MYGRKTPSTYRSTPSVYSHYTTKSSTNLRSTKSVRSLRVPWYQKPILHDAFFLDLQRGSLLAASLSVFIALFTFAQSIFDLYCLGMAAPGSVHYGFYAFSFQFVYVGSPLSPSDIPELWGWSQISEQRLYYQGDKVHAPIFLNTLAAPIYLMTTVFIRNVLIIFSLFSWLGSVAVLVTGIILIIALRKEHEKRIAPWLYTFGVFTLFRLVAFVFAAIVNDMIFAYNALMCACWALFVLAGGYGWLLVYSLYLELCDLTKLEDLAHLRMGTMASLNASLAGSRPTTPHSAVSTMPASQI